MNLHKGRTSEKVFCVFSCGQSSVATKPDTGEGRKTMFIILIVPGPRGPARIPHRATWEGHQGGQEAEDKSEGRKHLGHILSWGFHRRRKAEQTV